MILTESQYLPYLLIAVKYLRVRGVHWHLAHMHCWHQSTTVITTCTLQGRVPVARPRSPAKELETPVLLHVCWQ